MVVVIVLHGYYNQNIYYLFGGSVNYCTSRFCYLECSRLDKDRQAALACTKLWQIQFGCCWTKLSTPIIVTDKKVICLSTVFWAWNIVFRRRNLLLKVIHRIWKRFTESLYMLYCFEENLYLVHYCSQEQETGDLLF